EQVIGDPARLRQIILNLLSNAIKFTSRGKITLSIAKTADGMIQFSVTDTGIGVPEDKQETIFQPFKQADTSTSRRFGGTGLGLSICKKLVNKMGGNIWIESKPSHGSTFHFIIPCIEAKVQRDLQSFEGIQTQHDQVAMPKTLSILLADDAPENCMVIEAFLMNTSHHLTVVENGKQAVDKFKNGKFDLVLIDVHMPEMDGYEATMTIRSWERNNKMTPIPIIALTANAMKEDVERTRLAGCNLHLSKPISKRVLLETISQFIM
ncbi:MAG: response regulator, partial [Magnetococcales bacterium]|nr:response regulator [Magnetococcales bacterium]